MSVKERILEVKNLRISFRTNEGIVKAVRGIDFTLNRGETLAVVGESGSGKTVTARAVMGITAGNGFTEGGEILFDGMDLTKISDEDYRQLRGNRISMIFQDPFSSLNPIVKIGKQITETIIINNRASRRRAGKGLVCKITGRLAKSRAIELMEEVGIPEARARYGHYPFQFSGGMRQRIVIAIALAANPDVLICDEPSTALDVTIQAQILDLINSLKASRGLSVIFITHDLGVVANVADRVAVMYAGKIVEMGRLDDVFFTPAHPYTWALLSSMPDIDTEGKLEPIPGVPPNMINPPKGDAFAARNKYALEIDFEKEPPFFEISPTHKAATWLLHPDAPKIEKPRILTERGSRDADSLLFSNFSQRHRDTEKEITGP